jgi:hypothetical protein
LLNSSSVISFPTIIPNNNLAVAVVQIENYFDGYAKKYAYFSGTTLVKL